MPIKVALAFNEDTTRIEVHQTYTKRHIDNNPVIGFMCAVAYVWNSHVVSHF